MPYVHRYTLHSKLEPMFSGQALAKASALLFVKHSTRKTLTARSQTKLASLMLLTALLSLLSACASQPPADQPKLLRLHQAVDIPEGRTHVNYAKGKLSKADRFEPYCQLKTKSQLEGIKLLPAGDYPIVSLKQHYSEDDLTDVPPQLWSRFRLRVDVPFLNDEPVWVIWTLRLKEDSETSVHLPHSLVCYHEFSSYLEAGPFTELDFKTAVGANLSLH